MSLPVPPIVLASTSPFRRAALERLGVGFSTLDPKVDETPAEGEQAQELAVRLARAKALAGAASSPEAIVIAGDQTLAARGRIYGKPGSKDAALAQLAELAGQSGTFYSAMAVAHDTRLEEVCVATQVSWRELDAAQIRRYVEREPSYGSAGAAQLEAFGISLVSKLASDDPTAVLGLPLIPLCTILARLGSPAL